MGKVNSFSKEEALHTYRNAWKTNEIDENFYADDIAFYAPMKVFKGKKDVLSALKNWFGLIQNVTDCSYVVNKDMGSVLSRIFANNTGGEPYSFWEYDYFQFNERNQIKLYRPIFDTGAATHELLGFDIAARCATARRIADSQ